MAVASEEVATDTHPLPSWQLPITLLGVYIALWIWLAIAPLSREDWLMENLLVFVSLPLLVLTRHRLRFSNAAYTCIFAFFVLHAVGAHYTYSEVPYDEWWRALTGQTFNEQLGWHRNHFDRLVHFMYGALMLLPSVELFDRYAPGKSFWRWVVPLSFLMGHAMMYELFEWAAALVVAPDLGNAYLGTQGDPWDAHKDMALATLGSILALVWVEIVRGRSRTIQHEKS